MPEPWVLPAGAGVRACVRACVPTEPGFIALCPSQRHKPGCSRRVCVCTKHVDLLAGCCTFRLHACPRGSALVVVELFFFYIYISIYGWTGLLPL